MKRKPAGKSLKKLLPKGESVKHPQKPGNIYQENEPASPVCLAGKEKFREGFEDLTSGKSEESGNK